MIRSVLAALCIAGSFPAAVQAACPLRHWMSHEGTELLRAPGGGPYVFRPTDLGIDADGAPTAYHPEDVGKRCQNPGRGLDCPANAGYPNGHWWNVLLRDPVHPNRPYIQDSGPSQGYYLSATSLRRTAGTGSLNPLSYVDASQIPYLVFPPDLTPVAGTGFVGDVGFALNLETGDSTAFVFADQSGSGDPFGEASMAFWARLGGDRPNPRTGDGIPSGKIAIMVFPGSRHSVQLGWPIDLAELDRAVRALFGSDGEQTLRACIAR